MTAKRLQTHRNLISALLTYPTQATKLLHINQKLIDQDFLQLIEQVSVNMRKAGNQKAADFLENLANKVPHSLSTAQKDRSSSGRKRPDNFYLKLAEQKILNALIPQQGMHLQQEAIDYIANRLEREINDEIENNESATLHVTGDMIDIHKSIARGAKQGKIIVEREGIKFNNFRLKVRNKIFQYPEQQYKPSSKILHKLLAAVERANIIRALKNIDTPQSS